MKTRKHKHPAKGIRSKVFRRCGHFSVYKKDNGDIYMTISSDGRNGDSVLISDKEVLDFFIWSGRYLSEKKKLPGHLALNEIAIATSRAAKDIRAVIATDSYRLEILRNNEEQR